MTSTRQDSNPRPCKFWRLRCAGALLLFFNAVKLKRNIFLMSQDFDERNQKWEKVRNIGIDEDKLSCLRDFNKTSLLPKMLPKIF